MYLKRLEVKTSRLISKNAYFQAFTEGFVPALPIRNCNGLYGAGYEPVGIVHSALGADVGAATFAPAPLATAALGPAPVVSGYTAGGLDHPYGASGLGSTMYDTCHCVKTIVRPVVERIPYTTCRRVSTPSRLFSSRYGGDVLAGGPIGTIGAGSGIVRSRSAFLNGGVGVGGFSGGVGCGNSVVV